MTLTVPQIIMLGHAAHINSKRSEQRVDRKRKVDADKKAQDEANPVVFNGKRLDELNSDELGSYYGGWG